jgi:sugar phosphate isomerase/epimerase
MRPACASDWTILTSLEDALGVIREINHPHIKLAFDTYHLADGDDILAEIDQLVDLTAIVHLGDGKRVARDEQNRCPLGEGYVPLQEIITRFSQCGYTGYYDVELMGEDVEAIDYSDLIAQSLAVCEQLLAAPI